MTSIIISKRLQQVAAFVPQGARLLDVGSDHAYLPIYLTQKSVLRYAIAGEVVEGPFQSAQKNVATHGLSQQIEIRLANGLSAFEAADQIDTLVIAGMGGRLIADILAADESKLSGLKRLILQPNNREDELRAWLADHGFSLIVEAILEEAGKFYEILVAEPGQISLSQQELRFGPYLMAEFSSVFVAKWQKELDKLEYALAQIPTENREARQLLEDKIVQIKEVLHAR